MNFVHSVLVSGVSLFSVEARTTIVPLHSETMKPFFYIITLGFCMSLLAGSHVNADTAIPAKTQVPVSMNATKAVEFTVNGTEPFWNVTVNQRGIVYSSPEVKRQAYPYVAPMTASGRPADLLRVYRLRGKPEGMLIIEKVDSCSDGMSDRNYPYSAVLILGNRVLNGCAQTR